MKKRIIYILLTFFFMFSGSLTAQQNVSAPQKFALVIGNGNYSGQSRLANPVNDANDIAAALQGLGFTVDKVLDGSLDQMEKAVTLFKNRLSVSKNTYGFFYYAGHGVQSNGVNYLIPVNANIPAENYLRERALSVQVMMSELEEAGNDLNIIVLDACRDSPFSWSRSGSRGLALVSSPSGSIVMYATSANSVASDGTGRNGLFTGQLLKNLKTPGLSVQEVFTKTGADVLNISGGVQHPELSLRFFGTAYLGSMPAVVVPQPAPASTAVPQTSTTPQPAPASSTVPPPVHPPQETAYPANMVRVEGGTFQMGSPSNERERYSNEVQHRVTVSSFYMGKYEVTQAEYEAVMGTNPSYFKGTNLPVERVSWYDAVEYCNKLSQMEGLTPAYTIDKSRSDPNNTNNDDNVRWLVTWNSRANGYRLPTEAEWEYACRAGTTTPFNTGNNITTGNANYDGNYPYNNNDKGTYRKKTTAVGSFAPNPFGLYDMHGNVWEWCWDWYGDYPSSAQTNPTGASSGSDRMLRGGSWGSMAALVRSALRNLNAPSRRDYIFGFRVVRN